MTGKEDSYRAAAIRALCTITDPVMLQVGARHFLFEYSLCYYQIIPPKSFYVFCF